MVRAGDHVELPDAARPLEEAPPVPGRRDLVAFGDEKELGHGDLGDLRDALSKRLTDEQSGTYG